MTKHPIEIHDIRWIHEEKAFEVTAKTTDKIPIIYFNYLDENIFTGWAFVSFRAKQEGNCYIINEITGSDGRKKGDFYEGIKKNGRLVFE